MNYLDKEIDKKKQEISKMNRSVLELVKKGEKVKAQELFMKMKKKEAELSQAILDTKPWNNR